MTTLMFTKMLQRKGGLDVDEAGDVLVDLGFDGVDLSVRPGGHVEPESVTETLPEAVDCLRSKGLSVPLITTNVTGADEPYAEDVFETASECGIEHLKLGYWKYDEFGRFKDELDAMRVDLNGIYRLSQRYSVTPSIHVHSGDYVSAEAAVLWEVLRDYDPKYLGAYLDIGHMVLEGSVGGWKIGLDLLQDYAKVCAIKNFGWVTDRDDAGRTEWKRTKYPLEDGIVPYESVFDCLSKIGFDGPLSVHSEYQTKSFDELLAQTEADLEYLRTLY